MTVEMLDGLRDQFAGCKLMALADISAGIVLCTSAGKKFPQEVLDAYCTAAGQVFGEPCADAFSHAMGNSDLDTQTEAVVMSDQETLLFLRSKADPSEAIFSVCDGEIETGKFFDAARTEFGWSTDADTLK